MKRRARNVVRGASWDSRLDAHGVAATRAVGVDDAADHGQGGDIDGAEDRPAQRGEAGPLVAEAEQAQHHRHADDQARVRQQTISLNVSMVREYPVEQPKER